MSTETRRADSDGRRGQVGVAPAVGSGGGRGRGDHGFSTAELLGNAALGIAALVAIWAVLQALGVNIVAWIGAQLGVG